MWDSRNIPSVAPRGDTEIGMVRENNRVFISREFLRWLDGLRFRLQDTVTRAGTIKMTHEEGEPDGWLILNGQQVTERLYPRIAAIYGATDGIVTLPDMTNLLPMGVGSLVGNNATAGASEITLTTEQMPRHNHPVLDRGHMHAGEDRGHSHGLQMDSHTHEVTEDPDNLHTHGITDPGHTHPASITSGTVETGMGASGSVYDVSGLGFTGITETDEAVADLTLLVGEAEVSGTVSKSRADIRIHKAKSNITVDVAGDSASVNILNPVRGFYYWVKT